MNTSGAKRVSFDDRTMWVELDDGRTLEVALIRFPRLATATPEQRAQVWIGYEGQGLHWEDIDEDISVAQLIESDQQTDPLSVAAE